jgi:ribosomal protein L37AE/L43A
MLRHEYIEYSIHKHGSSFSADVHICPECMSSDVTSCKDGYKCQNCGCEFSETCMSQPTHLGKVIGTICKVLSITLFIAALLMFVCGVITAVIAVINGHTSDIKTIIAVTLGCPTMAHLLASILWMFGDYLLQVSEKKDKTEESEKNK